MPGSGTICAAPDLMVRGMGALLPSLFFSRIGFITQIGNDFVGQEPAFGLLTLSLRKPQEPKSGLLRYRLIWGYATDCRE